MTGFPGLARASCLVAAAAFPVAAQAPAPRGNEREAYQEIAATLMAMPFTVGGVAVMMVVARRCRPDKEGQWKRVIDAIDQRFVVCATQEPRWQVDVSREFAKEEAHARANGSSVGYGSLALERFWSSATRQIDERGTAVCAKLGLFVDPAAVSDKARADYLQADPSATPQKLEAALQRARSLLAFGIDTAWIDRPCRTFWPDAGPQK
ncbi:hypothetical protein [Reyranella sp.]|uniref:hypothetical protein n=1 Tax=Reyranella sp. TaxID=1929291 RepID=UPI003BAD3C63